jgi:dephospho-CoA kinase
MMEKLSVPDDKFIIGLTGNIATGKSAVMNLAIERGALAIDADKIVHEILQHDMAVQEAITNIFGPTVRHADGRIIRSALGEIVFDNPQAMRNLEAIIHPAVHRQVLSRIKESQSSIIIIEAIKLLEGKLRGICHTIWVTRCSRERQLERLRVCRGLDDESAVIRVDSQAPQEDKVLHADSVIDTDGLMDDTRRQFEQAWSRIPQPDLGTAAD